MSVTLHFIANAHEEFSPSTLLLLYKYSVRAVMPLSHKQLGVELKAKVHYDRDRRGHSDMLLDFSFFLVVGGNLICHAVMTMTEQRSRKVSGNRAGLHDPADVCQQEQITWLNLGRTALVANSSYSVIIM